MFNLSEDYSEQFDDHLFRFSTEFNQSKIANLKYHLTYFSRLPVVNALRNEIVVSTNSNPLLLILLPLISIPKTTTCLPLISIRII